MKKIFTCIAFIALALSTQAQTKFRLYIDHQLGDSVFKMNQETSNNLGNTFKVTRLQYYLSKFTIVHDGGQKTSVDSLYVLVDASMATEIDLGDHSGIDTVESLEFSVGVNAPENNEDPAQWPSTHPLAPKLPSMHWSWLSGYRFVALDGKTGASFNTIWELHGLGNDNYHRIILPVKANDVFGEMHIVINADYQKAIEDIDISSGPIVHGEEPEPNKMLLNFKQYVFSNKDGEGNVLASTVKVMPETSWSVYPNPSNGTFTITSSDESLEFEKATLTNMLGKEVLSVDLNTQQDLKLQLDQKGVFLLTLSTKNGIVSTRKIVVQ